MHLLSVNLRFGLLRALDFLHGILAAGPNATVLLAFPIAVSPLPLFLLGMPLVTAFYYVCGALALLMILTLVATFVQHEFYDAERELAARRAAKLVHLRKLHPNLAHVPDSMVAELYPL